MPFFSRQNDSIVSATGVYAPSFELMEDTHSEHTYPVEGWWWFESLEEAVASGVFTNSAADVLTVTPLQGMLAIHAAGLSPQFEAWASDPARTFAEKAFITRAQTWRIDDPILLAGAAELGLTSEQLENLFVVAKEF